MVTGLAEALAVGRAFLLSVGRADGAAHVENEPIHRRPSASADYPFLVEVGQGGEASIRAV